MAHSLHKHYGLLRHELTFKDLLRYFAIALIAVLGIAGLLQSIAGPTSSTSSTKASQYGTSVYSQ